MKQITILASGSLLFLLAGCSTDRIADYQPASPSISERTAQASGVELALDPFVESGRTEKYFDLNAVANGIAILHVRVTNKTADQTFLVEKKNFQLFPDVASGGLAGDGQKNERSVAAGTTLEIIGAGSLTMLAGLAMVSHSTEVQRNIVAKEMGDATLPPGKSMEGFIYFTPINKGEDWTRNAVVKINLANTKTQQITTLNIPLSR
jgi:hypothetical protein